MVLLLAQIRAASRSACVTPSDPGFPRVGSNGRLRAAVFVGAGGGDTDGRFFCYTRRVSTITLDTLKFVEKLKSAGVPEAQAKAEAEALVSAFSEAMDVQIATKADMHRIEKELAVLKWMSGIVMGGILALILKTFFPF